MWGGKVGCNAISGGRCAGRPIASPKGPMVTHDARFTCQEPTGVEGGVGVVFVRACPLAFYSSFRRVDWCVVNVDIPGDSRTGSTTTLHAVVRQLKRMAEPGVSQDSSILSCLTLTYVFRKKIHSRTWRSTTFAFQSLSRRATFSGKVSPGTTSHKTDIFALEGCFSGGGRAQGPGGHAQYVILPSLVFLKFEKTFAPV